MRGSTGSGKGLRIALVALAVLVLLPGSIVAYYLLDTNRLRGPLAGWISAQTGRRLTIRGDLSLELGRQPSLTVEGVELANADWAADPALVTAERIRVAVDVPSLLDGPLLIEQLRVEGARIRLEEAADGRGNWELFDDGADGEPGFAFDEGLPVVVRRLKVDDCLVSYSSPVRSQPLRLEIVSLDQETGADGFLHLGGQGMLEGRPIQVEGEIGPFAALLGARNFRHRHSIRIGDTEVSSRGSVGDLTALEEIEWVIALRAPDAGFHADLLGVPGALAGPIDLRAAIAPNQPGMRIEVAGTLGGFDLALSGKVARPLALDGLEMAVEIEGPDLAVVGEILEIPGLPAGPFDLAGSIRRSGGSLTVREATLVAGAAELGIDAEFAGFPDPDGGTLLLNLKGADLRRFERLLGRLPVALHGPFAATAALAEREDGDEHLEASIEVGENRLALDGTLGRYPEFANSRFEVELEGPDLGALLGPSAAVAGPYAASGDLTWTGSALEIEPLAVSMGPLAVRGRGSLENLSSFRGASLLLETEGPDLFALGEWLGREAWPHQPYSLSGHLDWGGEGLVVDELEGRIGEVEVRASARIGDPGRLAEIRLDFDAEGPGLDGLIAESLGFEVDDTPFELSGRLERGEAAVEASDLRYRSSKGTVRADGQLGVLPSFEGMKLAIDVRGPSLREVLPDLPGYTAPDRPYRLSGRIQRPGAFALVFDELGLELEGARASADGVWDFRGEPGAARFLVRATGSDPNALGEWEGLALPALPFGLEGRFDLAPGSIALDTVSATWGESDLRANARVDWSGKPKITAVVRSDRLDLDTLLKREADGGDEPDQAAPEDGRVIPDAALPLERLRSADLSLDLDVADLIVRGQDLERLELDLSLRNGALTVDPLEVVEAGGSILLRMSLTPEGERPELDLALTARNLRFGFFRAEGQAFETLPPYDIDMSLQGAGATTREIVADLSGSLRMASTGGLIVNSRVENWFDDFFVQLFNAILPFAEDDPYTRIDCAVLDGTFDHGTFQAKPGLVARTDKQNIFARGKIELVSERLDIGFRTEARSGIGISVGKILNPFFRIGGTLGDPALRLDATGAVISGTAAWATFGGSIALRTLWDRIQGTQNPCVRMLEPAK